MCLCKNTGMNLKIYSQNLLRVADETGHTNSDNFQNAKLRQKLEKNIFFFKLLFAVSRSIASQNSVNNFYSLHLFSLTESSTVPKTYKYRPKFTTLVSKKKRCFRYVAIKWNFWLSVIVQWKFFIIVIVVYLYKNI